MIWIWVIIYFIAGYYGTRECIKAEPELLELPVQLLLVWIDWPIILICIKMGKSTRKENLKKFFRID